MLHQLFRTMTVGVNQTTVYWSMHVTHKSMTLWIRSARLLLWEILRPFASGLKSVPCVMLRKLDQNDSADKPWNHRRTCMIADAAICRFDIQVKINTQLSSRNEKSLCLSQQICILRAVLVTSNAAYLVACAAASTAVLMHQLQHQVTPYYLGPLVRDADSSGRLGWCVSVSPFCQYQSTAVVVPPDKHFTLPTVKVAAT